MKVLGKTMVYKVLIYHLWVGSCQILVGRRIYIESSLRRPILTSFIRDAYMAYSVLYGYKQISLVCIYIRRQQKGTDQEHKGLRSVWDKYTF